jgi:hypothetical protein
VFSLVDSDTLNEFDFNVYCIFWCGFLCIYDNLLPGLSHRDGRGGYGEEHEKVGVELGHEEACQSDEHGHYQAK